MPPRQIHFESGPFGFVQGHIRCAKCGESDWSVDGRRSGLTMVQKKRLQPALHEGRMVLPNDWERTGSVNTDTIDPEIWRVILSENLQQVRHVDSMRLTLMSVYGGISALAGAVSFVAAFDKWLKVGILLSVALLTFIQLLIHLKLSKAFEHNMDHVRLLLAIAPAGAEFAQIGLFRQMKGMIIRNKWTELRILKLVPQLFILLTIFWVAAAIRIVVLQ